MKSGVYTRVTGLAVLFALIAFVPEVSAQPALHLRADSGITLNGSNVSVWADLSGNGRDATQPSATEQPLFVPSHPGIGGLPAIRFTGQKWLDFDGTFLAGTTYTIFVVEGRNPPDSSTLGNFFLAGSDGVTNANLVLGYENDTTLRLSHYLNDLDAVVPPFAGQEFHVTTFRLDLFGLSRTIHQDGNLLAYDLNLSVLTSFNGASIGHYPALPSFSYFGDIAEIIIYSYELPYAERVAIEEELIARYQIGGLPATIPTLSEVGMALLGLLLVGAAFLLLRR